jgi:hypothetical protein
MLVQEEKEELYLREDEHRTTSTGELLARHAEHLVLQRASHVLSNLLVPLPTLRLESAESLSG